MEDSHVHTERCEDLAAFVRGLQERTDVRDDTIQALSVLMRAHDGRAARHPREAHGPVAQLHESCSALRNMVITVGIITVGCLLFAMLFSGRTDNNAERERARLSHYVDIASGLDQSLIAELYAQLTPTQQDRIQRMYTEAGGVSPADRLQGTPQHEGTSDDTAS